MTLIDKAEALAAVLNTPGRFAGCTEAEVRKMVAEWIAAIPPAKQGHVADSNARGVGVKPLQWEQVHADYHAAETPFGAYEAGGDWYRAPDRRMCSRLVDPFSAAQADYEARILAALSSAPDATEKGGDAFEDRDSDRPNPATSPGVTAGADAAQAPAEDAHVKGETAGQMLERLGMDGVKWAAEFRTTALRLGYSDMDEGWLIGWFCNAIMAGYDRSAAQAMEGRDG